jgi:putative endonuclease
LSTHLDIGRFGEQIAAEWLLKQGYDLLSRNWKYRRMEIDIIACKNGILHFVEVKTRRSDFFGLPEEQVNRRKIKHLQEAAAAYQEEHPQWRRMQFDILAINLNLKGNSIVLLEDIS